MQPKIKSLFHFTSLLFFYFILRFSNKTLVKKHQLDFCLIQFYCFFIYFI